MEINYDKAEEYFNKAIEFGVLSENENDDNYAGGFMYMYSIGHKHYFKNKEMRNYVCFEDILEFTNYLLDKTLKKE